MKERTEFPINEEERIHSYRLIWKWIAISNGKDLKKTDIYLVIANKKIVWTVVYYKHL